MISWGSGTLIEDLFSLRHKQWVGLIASDLVMQVLIYRCDDWGNCLPCATTKVQVLLRTQGVQEGDVRAARKFLEHAWLREDEAPHRVEYSLKRERSDKGGVEMELGNERSTVLYTGALTEKDRFWEMHSR